MIMFVSEGTLPKLTAPSLSFRRYQLYKLTTKTRSLTMAWVMVALIRGTMVFFCLPVASFSHGPPFFLIMPTSWILPDMIAGTVVINPAQRRK